MVVLVVLIVALAPTALVVTLFAWARWLRRRTAAHRFFVWAAYALLGASAALVVFGMCSVAGAFLSFGVDTSSKARALAEGISEAMNCGAMSLALDLFAALWLLAGTWRWRWSVKPIAVEGEPPYR
ncbi:MAG TPA: hypothetical protein VIF62_13935 [Labilithrix sp.]